MAPLQGNSIRDQRLQEGFCPNCGNRLFIVSGGGVGGAVGGRVNMPKMFRKRSSSSSKSGETPTKMTPLTIPGVVERGQCLKCVDGFREGRRSSGSKMSDLGINSFLTSLTSSSSNNGGTSTSSPLPTVKAVPVPVIPSVKAVPVIVAPAPPHQSTSTPQSKPRSMSFTSGENNILGGGNLKQPPEDLLGLHNNANNLKSPPKYPDMEVYSIGSSSSSSSCEDSASSSSQSDDDGYDTESLEEDFENLGLCRLESDHASSSVVNNLKQANKQGRNSSGALEDVVDDRKPAAKPTPNTNGVAGDNSGSGGPHKISQQIEESAERIRRLRLEAAAVDMDFLEATTISHSSSPQKDDVQAAGVTTTTTTTAAATAAALECPSGMCPEIFYQLPPEMQKEVMEEGNAASNRSSSSRQNNNNGKKTGGGEEKEEEDGTTAADIDPETLASLPDSIRKEVLEQARREQQQKQQKRRRSKKHVSISPGTPVASLPTERRMASRDASALTKSTTAFLEELEMDADDFVAFPDEVKNDIMEEKRRTKTTTEAASSDASTTNNAAKKGIDGHGNDDDDDDDDKSESGYDPETLASLPEDVRKEVLDEERRQRGKKNEERKRRSSVGAHSVNVPAGYDPETFESLPKDVQRELLEHAAQQRNYSAEGYDSDAILDARIVSARPAGGGGGGGGGVVTSCEYTGEYNMLQKRHGDGELKWANGDKYVGKFKDGFIEGRGTISFHDGTEYSGQWKTNRFHGEGTRRFNNGNVYTGNYDSGKRQGQGRCYFANGDMYVGDWKDDTIHGFGRYYYNNGHSFEGMFRNGKRNGRGKYQLTDGRVEIYRYVNDSRVGDGVRWSANRKKAWRMNDGKVTKKVSIEEAANIAKRCGPIVEES